MHEVAGIVTLILRYLIDIPQLAVDVLAELKQQAHRTLIENMQAEEKREQPLGESRIL